MKSVPQILRSERGDLLVESVVGTVIVALTLIPVSGIIITASKTSSAAQANTTRIGFLHSVLAQETPLISSHTTIPVISTRTVNGSELPITFWREDTNRATAVLHAAVPGYGRGADCNDPSALAGCLTASTTVPLDAAGIALTKIPLNSGAEGASQTAVIGAGVQEIRYVFKVAAAPVADQVTLTVSPGTATAVVDVPIDQTGYYFGSLQVDPGTTISITLPEGATVDPDSILLYESPRP